jgi:ubiquinone/menaquinone biosynthesis C-methylase UbiE
MCDSSERHRVDWVFLKKYTNLFDQTPKKMLHVAPELFLARMFKKIEGVDYLSADLQDPRAMIKMDLTDIDLPDNLFDVIYCSHVLEHIIDDRKAMRELYRICKPGGWALLQVPINTDVTFEDASITSDKDRIRVFGQKDHVRNCGLDYPVRMKEAGFEVRTLSAQEILAQEEFKTMGILQEERYVFYCEKL